MKANWKSLLFLVSVVVVAALFFSFLGHQKKEAQVVSNTSEGKIAGPSMENSYIERLAKGLRDKGMVFYGSYQSAESIDQKALFGDSAKYLDYVECDASGPNANPDECISQKVNVYPSWMYEGKFYTGKKSLSELAEMIGFTE